MVQQVLPFAPRVDATKRTLLSEVSGETKKTKRSLPADEPGVLQRPDTTIDVDEQTIECTGDLSESADTLTRPVPQPNEHTASSAPPNVGEAPLAEGTSAATPPLTKKQIEKADRQRQREQEKAERERKREEEKARKEEERLRREEERQLRLEEKEAEKEARRRKLEEEKAERDRKREEERLRRISEREAKEHERAERKIKAEMEKRRAEEERRAAEEAKRLAEEARVRSQRRIESFFARKPAPAAPANTAEELSVNQTVASEGRAAAFDRVFLPFFQKSNVVMPTPVTTPEDDRQCQARFDAVAALQPRLDDDGKAAYRAFLGSQPQHQVPPGATPTPQQIVAALNSAEASETQIYQMMARLPPFKYLHFYENSKPAYVGTWCSAEHLAARPPPTDPFFRVLGAGIDYDYDSDLDWNEEEDGEGEDIEDEEDEEDEEEEDEGELEDFVDSNGERRKRIYGPLVSVCIWNDGGDDDFFEAMRCEPVNDRVQFPIDPAVNYWKREETDKTDAVDTTNAATSAVAAAAAAAATAAAAVVEAKLSAGGSTSLPNVLVGQKLKITDPQAILDLLAFVEANNDFTIGTLVELLHKKFKRFTKAVIRHTIQDHAVYNKKTGRWQVKEQLQPLTAQDGAVPARN